jgi:NAD(P)H dehydrogenase (quinone)
VYARRVFAIFGATGKVGGATVRALLERGAPVRAVLRDPARAREFAALGCETAVADLGDPGQVERATAGAEAVQVICPTLPRAPDAAAGMAAVVDAIASGLRAARPPAVLAISDYGAELGSGTGITLTFNHLESALGALDCPVIFLRSAEHMQNWSRFVAGAAESGVLTSLHQPLEKEFPTVSAPDVGVAAADLLARAAAFASTRIVSIEGPRRYSALDVAALLSDALGRTVAARALPRAEWLPALRRGGVGESYAELVVELYDAHNAGRIDADREAGELLHGATDLRRVLADLVAASA